MFSLDYGIAADNRRKRPFDGEDVSSMLSKRLTNKSYLRLCVSTKSLGYIIGKAGSVIDTLKVRGLIISKLRGPAT